MSSQFEAILMETTPSPREARLHPRGLHHICERLRVGAVSPYGNYLSTMLPRPFRDLEWHKGKKHRHRRLSLLRRHRAADW
jgi:hypothetical protein